MRQDVEIPAILNALIHARLAVAIVVTRVAVIPVQAGPSRIMLNGVVNLLMEVFKYFHKPKPLILAVDAFSKNQVLIRNISSEVISISEIRSEYLSQPFPCNYIVESGSQFYVYLCGDDLLKKERKVCIKVKTMDGITYAYKILWCGITPILK